MILIHITVGSRFPVERNILRSAAQKLLAAYGVDHAQVDISIVGQRKIKQLNQERLGHEGPTDVLSFPQSERPQHDQDFPWPPNVPPHLGDIVISFPEAVKAARKYGKRVDEQLAFYVEHGLLHLLGYHHD